MENRKYWHLSIEHVVLGALGTMVVFQAMRWGAGYMVQRGGPVGTLGKSVGALFSFPAQ